MTTENKIDWIATIALLLMLGSTIVAVQYYMNLQLNECTREPLVYAAKMYEEKFGQNFSGSGTFMMQGDSPMIYFSSSGLRITTPSNPDTNIDLSEYFVVINNSINSSTAP